MFLMAKKMTYTRYVWFVDRARRGKHPSTTSLMGKFEISLAQAQRDIEYMRYFLGAPLKYVAAEKGYELEDHAFSLPTVWVEDDELLLLALAKELVRDPDSQKILAKLLRKIAVNSRSGIGRGRACRLLQGHGPYRQKAGILNPLLDAILNRHPVEILHQEVFGPVARALLAQGDAAAPPLLPRQLVFAGPLLARNGAPFRWRASKRSRFCRVRPR